MGGGMQSQSMGGGGGGKRDLRSACSASSLSVCAPSWMMNGQRTDLLETPRPQHKHLRHSHPHPHLPENTLSKIFKIHSTVTCYKWSVFLDSTLSILLRRSPACHVSGQRLTFFSFFAPFSFSVPSPFSPLPELLSGTRPSPLNSKQIGHFANQCVPVPVPVPSRHSQAYCIWLGPVCDVLVLTSPRPFPSRVCVCSCPNGAAGGGGGGGGGVDLSTITCFKCGEKGHFANQYVSRAGSHWFTICCPAGGCDPSRMFADLPMAVLVLSNGQLSAKRWRRRKSQHLGKGKETNTSD